MQDKKRDFYLEVSKVGELEDPIRFHIIKKTLIFIDREYQENVKEIREEVEDNE